MSCHLHDLITDNHSTSICHHYYFTYMFYFKYKIEILVTDVIDVATFIIFGDDSEQLLDITASQLIDRIEARVRPTTKLSWI